MKYTYTIIYTNIYSNTFSKAQVNLWNSTTHKHTHHNNTKTDTHTDRQAEENAWCRLLNKKMENKTYIFIQINKNTFSGIIQETLFLCGYSVLSLGYKVSASVGVFCLDLIFITPSDGWYKYILCLRFFIPILGYFLISSFYCELCQFLSPLSSYISSISHEFILHCAISPNI